MRKRETRGRRAGETGDFKGGIHKNIPIFTSLPHIFLASWNAKAAGLFATIPPSWNLSFPITASSK